MVSLCINTSLRGTGLVSHNSFTKPLSHFHDGGFYEAKEFQFSANSVKLQRVSVTNSVGPENFMDLLDYAALTFGLQVYC